jgi:hypothetical protein
MMSRSTLILPRRASRRQPLQPRHCQKAMPASAERCETARVRSQWAVRCRVYYPIEQPISMNALYVAAWSLALLLSVDGAAYPNHLLLYVEPARAVQLEPVARALVGSLGRDQQSLCAPRIGADISKPALCTPRGCSRQWQCVLVAVVALSAAFIPITALPASKKLSVSTEFPEL